MWSGACGRAGAAWRQAVIAVRLSVSGFCTHEMVLGINVEWRLRLGRGCVEAGRVCCLSEPVWVLHA
jgi:hypothetical protein